MMALLTLWLATPAVARPACHMPPPATAAMDAGHAGHDMPKPAHDPMDDLRVTHLCLGCAMPDTQLAPIAAPVRASADHWLPPITAAATRALLPETPPPRA